MFSYSTPVATGQSSQPTVVKKPKHKHKPAPSPADAAGGLDYTSPLAPQGLQKYLDSAVRMKYGAQEKSIQRTAKQLPAWYQEYRNALSTGQQLTQGANAAAATALENQRVAASGIDAQQYGNIQATAQAGLPGGQPVDPEAATRAAQASAVDRSGTDAFRNMLAVEGQADSNRYGDLSAISRGSQLQDRTKLHQAFSDLKGQEGDYRVSQLADLIDKERTYGLSKAAFGLDATTAANNYDLGLRNAGYDPVTGKLLPVPLKPGEGDADGDGIPDMYDDAPGTKGDVKPGQYDNSGQGTKNNGKDKYGNTKVQRRSNNNNWNDGLDYARTLRKGAKPGVDPYANLQYGLSTQQHTPHDVATAVTYWATHNGMLTPALAKHLRHLGIKISPDHIIHNVPAATGNGYGSDTATG